MAGVICADKKKEKEMQRNPNLKMIVRPTAGIVCGPTGQHLAHLKCGSLYFKLGRTLVLRRPSLRPASPPV
jgi:hypothetical protein